MGTPRCAVLRTECLNVYISVDDELSWKVSMSEEDSNREGGLAVENARPKLAKPPLWKVVLLNDDYTPMEFVVEVLQGFFKLDKEQATRVMLHVHQKGKGVCGVFTREIAETKVAQVTQLARERNHPLLCKLEEV